MRVCSHLQIQSICELVINIEKYYQKPMDIEFSLYNGTLYVLQARPVTHLLSIPNGWVEFSL